MTFKRSLVLSCPQSHLRVVVDDSRRHRGLWYRHTRKTRLSSDSKDRELPYASADRLNVKRSIAAMTHVSQCAIR